MSSPNMQKQSQYKLISVGIFSKVYLVDNLLIRKVPRDNDRDNVQAIRNEATIYALLGNDTHIVNCLSAGQTVNYVDLEYYPRGDLKAYFERNKGTITSAFRMRIARQVIEAVVVIHRKCIVHSDLALRQFLLDANDNARLSDFAASGYPGQWALGMECASHYLPRDPDLPNTVDSDLFALGSVLYEVMAGETPYHGKSDKEIETLYKEENFPAVNKFLCGNVIMGCWKREWRSAEEVLARYDEYTHGM